MLPSGCSVIVPDKFDSRVCISSLKGPTPFLRCFQCFVRVLRCLSFTICREIPALKSSLMLMNLLEAPELTPCLSQRYIHQAAVLHLPTSKDLMSCSSSCLRAVKESTASSTCLVPLLNSVASALLCSACDSALLLPLKKAVRPGVRVLRVLDACSQAREPVLG